MGLYNAGSFRLPVSPSPGAPESHGMAHRRRMASVSFVPPEPGPLVKL